eukprot:COSAG01_NODE_3444_length_6087_cov_8.153140_7_plen_102_part_00
MHCSQPRLAAPPTVTTMMAKALVRDAPPAAKEFLVNAFLCPKNAQKRPLCPCQSVGIPTVLIFVLTQNHVDVQSIGLRTHARHQQQAGSPAGMAAWQDGRQ